MTTVFNTEHTMLKEHNRGLGKLILALCLILMLFACGKNAGDYWQEQYDLGQKYLIELDYEQALIAFTNAIEIDPARGEAYIGRGDTYVSLAQIQTEKMEISQSYQSARNDYETGITSMELTYELFEKLADVYMAQGDQQALADFLQKSREQLGEANSYQKWENYLSANTNQNSEDNTEEEQAEEPLDPEVAKYVSMGLRLCEELNSLDPISSGFSANFDYAKYYFISKSQYENLLQPRKAALYILMEKDKQYFAKYGETLEDVLYILGNLDELHELRKALYQRTSEDKFNPDGFKNERDFATEYYDGNGVLIKQETNGGTWEYTYYDDGRNWQTYNTIDGVGTVLRDEFEYDAEGRIFKTTLYASEEDVDSTNEFIYSDGKVERVYTFYHYNYGRETYTETMELGVDEWGVCTSGY